MDKFNKLEKKGLIEAFNLNEGEVFEAKFNLFGFFGVLQKIDQRLEKEKAEKLERGKHD